MNRPDLLARASLSLVLALCTAVSAAQAQRTPTESIPGGVEAKPSDQGATIPKSQPAPAPAPMVGSPSRSPSLESAPSIAPVKPASPAKDPKAEKDKKKSSKAKEPIPLVRSLAPGAGAPAAGAVGTPAAADESKPGAVERAPAAPKQPPQ
jgi:hypothetical protein